MRNARRLEPDQLCEALRAGGIENIATPAVYL